MTCVLSSLTIHVTATQTECRTVRFMSDPSKLLSSSGEDAGCESTRPGMLPAPAGGGQLIPSALERFSHIRKATRDTIASRVAVGGEKMIYGLLRESDSTILLAEGFPRNRSRLSFAQSSQYCLLPPVERTNNEYIFLPGSLIRLSRYNCSEPVQRDKHDDCYQPDERLFLHPHLPIAGFPSNLRPVSVRP